MIGQTDPSDNTWFDEFAPDDIWFVQDASVECSSVVIRGNRLTDDVITLSQLGDLIVVSWGERLIGHVIYMTILSSPYGIRLSQDGRIAPIFLLCSGHFYVALYFTPWIITNKSGCYFYSLWK